MVLHRLDDRLGQRRLRPVDAIGIDAQFLAHHRSGLAAMEPVQDHLAFKGFVEFPMHSDRGLFHRLFLIHSSPDFLSVKSRYPQTSLMTNKTNLVVKEHSFVIKKCSLVMELSSLERNQCSFIT
jgi:hypothetical protein